MEKQFFNQMNVEQEEFISMLIKALKKEMLLERENKFSLLEFDLLTPIQVDELLDISHTTRIEWSKKGILNRHYLGSKVYYLRSEIKTALIPEEKRIPGRAA